MNNIKIKLVNVINKVSVWGFATAAYVMSSVMSAYATNTTEATTDADEIAKQVTGPIDTLTTILVTIFAAFGGIWLVKSVPELITAIQSQDSSGIFHAARNIACALLLGGLPLIIKLFAL